MKKILPLIISLALLLSLPVSASQYSEEDILAALYEADISEISDAIKSGLVTSRQVTQYYLERINEYNGRYNCFITLCDDALHNADIIDAKIAQGETDGLLLGVPIVIKDNMDYIGYPTTNGYSKKHAGIAKDNAYVVQRLLDEGAVILGKTNMSTDADSARHSISVAGGETYNAYSTELSPGGSSGGTAAAVSLNFAAAGLGTDTNSSLRLPAALNGCVSMRTTTGLISTQGCTPLNPDRDVPGAITRTVKDQALMLDVLTDNKYSFTENLSDDALRGKTIAIVSELCFDTERISGRNKKYYDEENYKAFANAISEMQSMGAKIVYISIPEIEYLSDMCDEEYYYSDKYKENFLTVIKDAANGADALIYPTLLTSPLSSGMDANSEPKAENEPFYSNCYLVSPAAGIPEITVPIGQHSKGAGIGLEIASLKGNEQLLLDIAYSYTESCNHRAVPENVPNLHSGIYSISDLLYTPPAVVAIRKYIPTITVPQAKAINYTASPELTVLFTGIITAVLIIILNKNKGTDR